MKYIPSQIIKIVVFHYWLHHITDKICPTLSCSTLLLFGNNLTPFLVHGISEHIPIPVVVHKAVAEVSQIGHYRRGELL